MVARRGEVWWADLPDPSGSEPGFRRPAVVVQADAFNVTALRTVVCVGVSSNRLLAEAPGNVPVARAESGLPKDSVVVVTQIFTVDEGVLGERIGEVRRSTMRRIENGLRLVLDL